MELIIMSQKVVVVTGSSSGLGHATVEKQLSLNNLVVGIDIREQQSENRNFHFVKCDVTDKSEIFKAFEEIVSKHGRVDVLINCAGIISVGKIHSSKTNLQLSPEHLLKVFKINVLGTIYMIQAFTKHYLEKKLTSGVIINVSSVAAEDGQQGQVGYSMTKGALNGMTLPLARELGGFGIRVVTIMPGIMETAMSEGMPKRLKKILVKASCTNRLGNGEDFAKFCQSIIENDYLTGVNLRLDGGIRMPKL